MSILLRLNVMMFLQFFVWGAWFATLGLALGNYDLGDITGDAYSSAPIAAIFAPLFLGLIADRFFASEKVMGILLLIGGVLLLGIPMADADPKLIYLFILGHMLCYMPTLGLGNTIAFTHIQNQSDFPKIRVWGTIGWIVAGLVVGGLGWSASMNMFWLAGSASIILGAFCFTLPNTPPPMKGEPIQFRSLLMVDAWRLLKDRNFFVFAISSTLICVPLAYYYSVTSVYLGQTGFTEPAATMTLGQMSEIFFMLLIPFFFRKLGLKSMILIGMACWVLRYLLFAFGAPSQITWMILLAVAMHGICYDFFFVTGFMYTDQKAPREIRGQAQSLLVFLTQGIGMFFGYKVAAAGSFLGIDLGFTIGEYGKQISSSKAYENAIKEASGELEPVSFFETFATMFSRQLPDGLDQVLLSETMLQWKNFWIFPSIMAGGIFILFFLLFHDKAKSSDESDGGSNSEPENIATN
ncbi:MAG: MFS transporter [Rubripirellula sp.]